MTGDSAQFKRLDSVIDAFVRDVRTRLKTRDAAATTEDLVDALDDSDDVANQPGVLLDLAARALVRLARDAPETGEVVAVTVPQLNNGTPTLVVFCIPVAEEQRHRQLYPGREMTFDEAHSVALGPPLVLTTLDLDPSAG